MGNRRRRRNQPTDPVPRQRGGETRSQRKEREYRTRMDTRLDSDPVPVAKQAPGIPPERVLPDGIAQVLEYKSRLQEELRLQIKKPVMVSIDILEGEWVYVVRGFKPPFSYWNGHKVLFYRSMDTSKTR